MCEKQNNAFSTLFHAMEALYWSAFGLVNLYVTDLEPEVGNLAILFYDFSAFYHKMGGSDNVRNLQFNQRNRFGQCSNCDDEQLVSIHRGSR